MRKVKTISKLRDHVNTENNTNFSYHNINYIKGKLVVSSLGKPNDDAKNLLRLLHEKEREEEEHFRHKKIVIMNLIKLNTFPNLGSLSITDIMMS